jgi:hypothetical protein
LCALFEEVSVMTELLADFVPIRQFAKDVGKTTRCVLYWMAEPDGLPYTRLGNQRFIHIESARAWLMRRMQNSDRRRHKGAR